MYEVVSLSSVHSLGYRGSETLNTKFREEIIILYSCKMRGGYCFKSNLDGCEEG
jgi:hypothetical protein